MSADKCYAWEHRKFPWHYRVKIAPEHRWTVATELSKRFGFINRPLAVRLDRRGGGEAHVMQRMIRLPSHRHPCSLGLILHEIAHVYDWVHYEGNGHRASFKKSFIKLCVEARMMKMLVPIYAKIREERAQMLARVRAQNDRSQRAMSAAQRAAERKVVLAAEKKTPEYRLASARSRAKTLATRIKRLQTALRKAERQAGALERVVSKKKNPSQCAPVAEPDAGRVC